ncbi:hypothetical protein Adt_05903 [Abeliophyllum distichum]|uniref:Uncharacterized protein n=1 Tax=Abeliophyllum distichum TaxID=126358 RepID=A0ABD1V5N4_9LAMI
MTNYLNWKVIDASKEKLPESLERPLMVEEKKESFDRAVPETGRKCEILVEEYKKSEEYCKTVGMVGVHGREMAFRKIRDWLVAKCPDLDLTGDPFIPEDDKDDDDGDEVENR